MSDREDARLAVGLALILFGPGYATQLELTAAQQSDPKWREFYLGAAQVVRGAASNPAAAVNALEDLWDDVFGKKPRRRKQTKK